MSWTCGSIRAWCTMPSRRRGPRSSSPSDLYLEGSDQHRGWFHSSLLTSVAMHGRAPYRGVLTHGFTVDEKGRKMSKSVGNILAPQKLTSTLGADVVRLWIAATDYANEMSVSDEILKRMADSYRRIRNTLRFLLGNMHGFDPAAHAVRLERSRGDRSMGDRRGVHLAERRGHGVSQLRVSRHLSGGAQLLRGRARRLLPRHHQGPALHHRCREPAAPLGADRACTTSPMRWCAGSRRS